MTGTRRADQSPRSSTKSLGAGQRNHCYREFVMGGAGVMVLVELVPGAGAAAELA
jgi:hypothetical protein